MRSDLWALIALAVLLGATVVLQYPLTFLEAGARQ